MYEKWPNALELPLGQEEGSREAQSKEKSERVGRRTTLPERELFSQGRRAVYKDVQDPGKHEPVFSML